MKQLMKMRWMWVLAALFVVASSGVSLAQCAERGGGDGQETHGKPR